MSHHPPSPLVRALEECGLRDTNRTHNYRVYLDEGKRGVGIGGYVSADGYFSCEIFLDCPDVSISTDPVQVARSIADQVAQAKAIVDRWADQIVRAHTRG